ncbi:MAG: TRAP transporter small permease subunit [Litorimonas sp.]
MAGDVIHAIGWVFLPSLLLPVLFLLLPSDRLASILSALTRTIDTAVHMIGEVVKWSIPLLVVSVAASVFALSVFGTATVKWLESAFYFQAAIILLGSAATLLAGQHVRVDIFHERMSPKARARVDLVGFYLLLVPVCLLIVWNSQTFVGFAWQTFEGSTEADGIRGVFLLKTMIPTFGVLMIAQGLAIATRAALVLADRPQPDRPEGVPPFFKASEPSP